MGNRQPTKFSVSHIWIEKPSAWNFTVRPTQFINKSKPDINIDEIVWQKFSSELEEHVPELNVGMRYVWFVYFVALGASLTPIVMFPWLLQQIRTGLFLNLLVPSVLWNVAYYFLVVQPNQSIDERILKVCETYNGTSYFPKYGFTVEYRTQFTEFWRPKHTFPSRVILFNHIPNHVSTIENKDNDDNGGDIEYFDRKSWGLDY